MECLNVLTQNHECGTQVTSVPLLSPRVPRTTDCCTNGTHHLRDDTTDINTCHLIKKRREKIIWYWCTNIGVLIECFCVLERGGGVVI